MKRKIKVSTAFGAGLAIGVGVMSVAVLGLLSIVMADENPVT